VCISYKSYFSSMFRMYFVCILYTFSCFVLNYTFSYVFCIPFLNRINFSYCVSADDNVDDSDFEGEHDADD
jgi:hypothetical protein